MEFKRVKKLLIVEYFLIYRYVCIVYNFVYMINKSYLFFDVKYLIKEDCKLIVYIQFIDFLNMGFVLFLNFLKKGSINEKKL